VSVTAGNLRDYIGRPKFTPDSAERTALPGVATGLAVTGAGGDVLPGRDRRAASCGAGRPWHGRPRGGKRQPSRSHPMVRRLLS